VSGPATIDVERISAKLRALLVEELGAALVDPRSCVHVSIYSGGADTVKAASLPPIVGPHQLTDDAANRSTRLALGAGSGFYPGDTHVTVPLAPRVIHCVECSCLHAPDAKCPQRFVACQCGATIPAGTDCAMCAVEAEAGPEPADCKACEGEGHVDAGDDYDLGMSTKPCPTCHGEGAVEVQP